VGLLAVALLMINNVRDVETDAATGKRTLAVRVGARTYGHAYGLVMVVPFALLSPSRSSSPRRPRCSRSPPCRC
jgi:1,4-dihydroxy-2-naphthoate polyprenyltransferase